MPPPAPPPLTRLEQLVLDAGDELEDAVEHVRSHGIEVFGPHQFGDIADAYFFSMTRTTISWSSSRTSP